MEALLSGRRKRKMNDVKRFNALKQHPHDPRASHDLQIRVRDLVVDVMMRGVRALARLLVDPLRPALSREGRTLATKRHEWTATRKYKRTP